jgi:hypothetical protein
VNSKLTEAKLFEKKQNCVTRKIDGRQVIIVFQRWMVNFEEAKVRHDENCVKIVEGGEGSQYHVHEDVIM